MARSSMPVQRSKPIGAGIALLLVMATAILAGGRETAALADSTFAVFVQPASTPLDQRPRIDAASDILAERDFVVVEDAETFLAEIEARSPLSIWIHADALDLVPDDVSRQLLGNGRVIVGIAMPSRLLTDKLNVEQSSTPDRNPEGYTTFVLVAEALTVPYTNELGGQSTRGSFTFGNDYFEPASPGPLLFLVEDVAARLRETFDGSPWLQSPTLR